MSNDVTISCTLDTTDSTAKLGFEAWIDDHKFFDTDHVQGPLKISVAVTQDGSMHDLSFILKNKTTTFTDFDAKGKKTPDAEVLIEDLYIGNIPIVHVDNRKESYLLVKDNSDIPEGYQGPTIFPTNESLQHWFSLNGMYSHDYNGYGLLENHKFYGSLGCNGTAKIKICLASAIDYFSDNTNL